MSVITSKAFINFISRRHISMEKFEDRVFVYRNDNDNEPMFTLIESSCEPDTFAFAGNVMLPAEIKEELPAFYNGERDLKRLCDWLFKAWLKYDFNAEA